MDGHCLVKQQTGVVSLMQNHSGADDSVANLLRNICFLLMDVSFDFAVSDVFSYFFCHFIAEQEL